MQVAVGNVLTVVVTYAPNSSSDYLALLSDLKRVPSKDLIVVLRDFNALVGNNGGSRNLRERDSRSYPT